MIRCASVAHHFDWDQRCLKLEKAGTDENSVILAPIPTATQGGKFVVPPGMYVLHVVRKPPMGGPQVRVPSVAHFVKVQ